MAVANIKVTLNCPIGKVEFTFLDGIVMKIDK